VQSGTVDQAWWRTDVQALRGVAVLLAVGYHTDVLPGGFVGVDVFFVVSGFVITGLLLRELGSTGRVSIRRFAMRRALRLLPTLATVIAVVCVGARLLTPIGVLDRSIGTARAAATMHANVYLYRWVGDGYFDVAAVANPFLHTWSLSVEEQLYLVVPLALALAWRWRRRTGVLLVVAVASVVSCTLGILARGWHALASVPRVDALAFYLPVTRAWEFGIGALVAIGGAALRLPNRKAVVLCATAGSFALGVASIRFSSTTPMPGVAALLPVGGAALLLVAGNGRATTLANNQVLRWIGDRSYSIYLWHWPFVSWAAAASGPGHRLALVAAATVSVVPASASYRWVERNRHLRLLGEPSRSRKKAAAVVSGCLLAPLIVSWSVDAVGQRYERRGTGAQAAAALRQHLDRVLHCDGPLVPSQRAHGACFIHAAAVSGNQSKTVASSRRVVLIGDSTAGHYSDAVAAAASTAGYDLVIATRSACAFVAVEVTVPGSPEGCRSHVEQVLSDIATSPPDVVILATSTAGILTCDGCSILDPKTGNGVFDLNLKASLFHDGLRTVLARLRASGTRVVLVRTAPRLGDWSIGRCTTLQLLEWAHVGSCAPAPSVGVAELEAQVQAVEANAAAGLATTVDVASVVCPDGVAVCTAHRDGRWIYRDGTHLTIDGAAPVADLVAAQLASGTAA
jgi:peptidoglycan/LPS O-acetylase OafA/YrhL/lysophospholipase L1-like esterase